MKVLDKLKKESNKKILFIIMIIVIIIIDIIMYSKFIYNDRSYYTEDYLEYNSSLDMEGKVQVSQSFFVTRTDLEAVAIGFDKEFRTYNDSNINIKIIDKKIDKVVAEYDNIYNDIVQNEKVYKFPFDKQNTKLREYEILITYENGAGDNPILINENSDSYQNGELLTINGEKQKGNISFKLYYSSKYANGIFTVSIIAISLISIISIFIVVFKNIKFEKLFVSFAVVVGLIYVFVIPMYRGHDEHAHFFKAYEISTGVFNTPVIEGKSLTEVPVSVFDVLHEDYNKEERYINKTYYDDIIRSRHIKIDKENNCYVGGEYMAVYSPIPYIPQALTIKIVSLFTKNLLVIFYMTRIVNLLVSILLLYLAIKIIPFGKKIIFFILIIPTTMSQISSVSPDALTITSSILFIAYLLKLLNSKDKVKTKDIIVLSGISVILGLCKIVYIPLVLLTLLIPKDKYEKKRDRILMYVFTIGLPIIINLLWLSVASKHLALIDNNKSDVQKMNILLHPLEYLRICIFTLYRDFDLYIMQLFGGYMEHVEAVNVGWVNVIALIILFTLIVLFDNDVKEKLNKASKITISIILFIICGLIFTSIYMQWSSLKYYYINGIQGRYFIELLLPFMIVLAQNKLVRESRKINLVKLIAYSGIILNTVATLTAVITYI